jgi:transcriptional regulator with XRE-family HTH domain
MAADSQLNQIKAKKIGLFLRDARTSANKTIRECSDAIGVTPHRFKLYEAGELSPSLPELEALSYFLGIKLSHFFGDQFISEETVKGELPTTVDQYKLLRHRVIGTHLRLVRSELKTSLKDLSVKTTISTSRLAKYEKGESSIIENPTAGIIRSKWQGRQVAQTTGSYGTILPASRGIAIIRLPASESPLY